MDPLILPEYMAAGSGSAFPLINSTGALSGWGPINNEGGSINPTERTLPCPRLGLRHARTNLSIQTTLYYTSLGVQDTHVDAWRPAVVATEPTFG